MAMVDSHKEITYNLEKIGKTIEDVVSVNVKVFNPRYNLVKYFTSMEKLVTYLKRIKYNNFLGYDPKNYDKNAFVIEGIILFSDKTWLERETVLYRFSDDGKFLGIEEIDFTLEENKNLSQIDTKTWTITTSHECWVYHNSSYTKDANNYFEGDMLESVENFLTKCNKTFEDIKSLRLKYSNKIFDIMRPVKDIEVLKFIKDSENSYIVGRITFNNNEYARVYHKHWSYYTKNNKWIDYGRV